MPNILKRLKELATKAKERRAIDTTAVSRAQKYINETQKAAKAARESKV